MITTFASGSSGQVNWTTRGSRGHAGVITIAGSDDIWRTVSRKRAGHRDRRMRTDRLRHLWRAEPHFQRNGVRVHPDVLMALLGSPSLTPHHGTIRIGCGFKIAPNLCTTDLRMAEDLPTRANGMNGGRARRVRGSRARATTPA